MFFNIRTNNNEKAITNSELSALVDIGVNTLTKWNDCLLDKVIIVRDGFFYFYDEGLWEQLKNKVVPVQDVRATLAAVESGNVEAGFVYKTDAAVSKKVKIIYEVPIEKGPKITYPVAVIKASKHKSAARDFTSYLQSAAGKDAFKRYGFVVLE
jgi:ABC-type amino acid transport substrate-binding protein